MPGPYRSGPRPPTAQPGPNAMRNAMSARPITNQQANVAGMAQGARGPMSAPAVVPQPAQQAPAQGAQAAQRPGQFKYTANVRNPPQPGMGPQPAGAQQAVHIQGQEPLTATMLAVANPDDQKQMLGERLFPLIQVRDLMICACQDLKLRMLCYTISMVNGL